MITILGRDIGSAAMLRAATAGAAETLTVAWNKGEGTRGAANAMKRLDAVEQLVAMLDAGVKTIEWTTDRQRAVQWVKDGAMVFGRKLRHTQGRDIVMPHRTRLWMGSEWWSKVVPEPLEEWRLHCMRERLGSDEYLVIARGHKVQVGGPVRVEAVRNRRNNWRLEHTSDPPKGLRTLAKKAVAACGYDWGAVDLIVGADGQQYVLEVNRAPGLDNYTCEAYVRGFKRLANG